MITNFWILYIALFSRSQLGMSRGGFIKLLVRRVIHKSVSHLFIISTYLSPALALLVFAIGVGGRVIGALVVSLLTALHELYARSRFASIESSAGSVPMLIFAYGRRMKETRNGNEIDNYANFSFILLECNTKLKFFFDNKSKTHCVSSNQFLIA